MTDKQKILHISKKLGLTHIGSNLTNLIILNLVREEQKQNDFLILDNAHAHLSHLIFKKLSLGQIERSIKKYGIHCDRAAGCDASGGSLGHGLGIAIGYALANPKMNITVVVSDGSMQEGSNWEALRLKSDLNLDNIKIYTNFNGYTALAAIDREILINRMQQFCDNVRFGWTENGSEYVGLAGHYKKI